MEKEKTLPQKRRVVRKTAAKVGDEPDVTVSPETRRKMIGDAAYYRFMRRSSGNGGDHVEDWLQAEAEIDALLGKRNERG